MVVVALVSAAVVVAVACVERVWAAWGRWWGLLRLGRG